MPRHGRGFTLIELLLALAIAAAALVIALGGLRVALAAWSRGEERAAQLDHARGAARLIEGALEGAFPYRLAAEGSREARLLFEGRADGLVFVTLSPPVPTTAPIAFTAVGLAREAGGLTLRQQPLPNRLALETLAPVVVDPATGAVRFRYLAEETGAWRDGWSAAREQALPRAVQVTLVPAAGRRDDREHTFTVTLPAGAP